MTSQILGVSIFRSAVYSGTAKETSKLHVTGLCEGNPPVTDGGENVPGARDSNHREMDVQST